MAVIAALLLTLVLARTPQDDSWRAAAEAARTLALPALSDEDVARWSAHVAPTRDELAFEEIPWIASFAEGLRGAEQAGKPLLFWAMNGHPLGCT